MYARIFDGNISGHLSLSDVESPDSLMEDLHTYAGRWRNWDGEGMALLSEPYAYVFISDPDEVEADVYPDYVVTGDVVSVA